MPKQVWYESGFFGGAGGEKPNIEPIWWDKWNFDYNIREPFYFMQDAENT